ncbi:hypothetical protein GUJ93_ZPchr0011g28894 [Zizania palustris]|uniref:DUF7792 domain-containing protein n=1 Tax=Zizania palustris TaxID=103762 RepID=A0A8J5WL69_ZIZPA|nr:hypothetical protein GUJ93_ZPchr0011g28894 [Zizania palustris]
MEALNLVSSVATVVNIVQDITKAVKTVSRNRESCQELAERVNDIGEVLKELDPDGSSPSTSAAAATRRLVRRLEGALGRALKLVRSCQKGSVIRPYSPLVGDSPIEDVNAEIDRCLLDVLGIANLVLVSRLDHKLNAAAGGDPNPTTTDHVIHVTEDNYENDEMAGSRDIIGDDDNYEMTTAAVEITCMHDHQDQRMPPASSNGYHYCTCIQHGLAGCYYQLPPPSSHDGYHHYHYYCTCSIHGVAGCYYHSRSPSYYSSQRVGSATTTPTLAPSCDHSMHVL